jgi:hypothetical protein
VDGIPKKLSQSKFLIGSPSAMDTGPADERFARSHGLISFLPSSFVAFRFHQNHKPISTATR